MARMAAKKAPKRYLSIKHCIRKMQYRAKWVGMLYLIAMLAVIGLVFFQPIRSDRFALSMFDFWVPYATLFGGGDFLEVLINNVASLLVAVLYTLMLLVLLINLIKALCKLKWLFKRKASKLYGFNRNMYAMDDIEKTYSSSLKAVLSCYFMIAVITGGIYINYVFAILLAVGIFFHFLCGMMAGNISLFTVDEEIIEEKRNVGTFSVFVRNFLQIGFTLGCMFFFLNSFGDISGALLEASQTGVRSAVVMFIVVTIVRLIVMLFIVGMICYAFGTMEFDPSGKKARGQIFLWISMLNFVFSFGTAIFVAVYCKLPIDNKLLFVAGCSLGAFIMEICLRKYPKEKEADADEVDARTYLENLKDTSADTPVLPPVYIALPPFNQDNNRG